MTPALTPPSSQLTPFVAKNVEAQKGKFGGSSPMSGANYLKKWKKEGGTS